MYPVDNDQVQKTSTGLPMAVVIETKNWTFKPNIAVLFSIQKLCLDNESGYG